MRWKIAYVLVRVLLMHLALLYIVLSIVFQFIWWTCGKEMIIAIEWVRGGCIIYCLFSIVEYQLFIGYLFE